MIGENTPQVAVILEERPSWVEFDIPAQMLWGKGRQAATLKKISTLQLILHPIQIFHPHSDR